jgi:2,3-bisphosphoglycerate-independent phosphoglycerate mutase
MSALEINQAAVKKIETEKYDFILINFANGDLVGHSGNFLAAKKAVETLDQALSKIVPAALENKYAMIITADHGNCEYMTNPDGSQNPSHTLNPVRVVIVTKDNRIKTLKKKQGLSSIAPTILKLMGVRQPKEMSGTNLF